MKIKPTARLQKAFAVITICISSFFTNAQCIYLDIIEKYAPKIYLHDRDLHRPMDVETFIANSTLYDENEQVILSNVTLDDLTNPVYNQSNYSLGNYSYQGGYYGPANVLSDRTGDSLNTNNEVTSKCYAKLIEHQGYVDIVYSFFYQWNGFQVFRTSILDGFTTKKRNFEWRDFARHEGDWEHITVRLTPDMEEVIGIFGSAHGDSKYYSIYDGVLTFDGTHPVFYAALNSHATYPTPGIHSNSDITTFPVFSIQWLKDADITGDETVNTYESGPFPDSIVWRTWNNILWVDNPADSVDAHKWLNFVGQFGVDMPESQVEDTPGLPGNAESDLYVGATVGGFVGLLDDYIQKSGPSAPQQQGFWWQTKEADEGERVKIYRTDDLGSGELEFNDGPELTEDTELNEIYIRTGSRVDKVEFLINDTTNLAHGGSGGTLNTLVIAPGDKVNQIEMYSDSYNGDNRIFWIKFSTEQGVTLEGGSQSGTYMNIDIPADKQVVGMYGKSGSEVDNLGFLLIDVVPIAPCTNVTAVDKQIADLDLLLHPNPASDYLHVESSSKLAYVEVFTLTGARLYSEETDENKFLLDVSNLAPGVYIVNAIDEEGVVGSQKFVK